MAESKISQITLVKSKEEYSADENIEINVQFSIEGDLRNAFNEANWTKAYNNNDVSMKLKYGVKLTSGGFRKKELGRTIDSYRKAAIFWTRNPKLVNPMKDRRIWVQIAKNFDTNERIGGTLSSVLYTLSQGIQIFRVHNVEEVKQGILVFKKLLKQRKKNILVQME